MVDGFRRTALRQTVISLESIEKLQEVHLRPTSIEYVNEWPVAIVGTGQDSRATYVNAGPGTDKEIIGVIEIDLINDGKYDDELIYNLLDLVDDIEVQIEADIATFRGLDPPVYIMSPVSLDEDPVIDTERELTAVRCRFTYHNGL